MEGKTTEAQKRASRAWEERNRKKSYRSRLSSYRETFYSQSCGRRRS